MSKLPHNFKVIDIQFIARDYFKLECHKSYLGRINTLGLKPSMIEKIKTFSTKNQDIRIFETFAICLVRY